jgi:hypothetical protein
MEHAPKTVFASGGRGVVGRRRSDAGFDQRAARRESTATLTADALCTRSRSSIRVFRYPARGKHKVRQVYWRA